LKVRPGAEHVRGDAFRVKDAQGTEWIAFPADRRVAESPKQLKETFDAVKLLAQHVQLPSIDGLAWVELPRPGGATYRGPAWLTRRSNSQRVHNVDALRRVLQRDSKFEARRNKLRNAVIVLAGFAPNALQRLRVVTTGGGLDQQVHLALSNPARLKMPDQNNWEALDSMPLDIDVYSTWAHVWVPLRKQNPALHEFLWADAAHFDPSAPVPERIRKIPR